MVHALCLKKIRTNSSSTQLLRPVLTWTPLWVCVFVIFYPTALKFKIIKSGLLNQGVPVLQYTRTLVDTSAHGAKLTDYFRKKITKQRPARPSVRTISRKVDQATPSRKETPPLEPVAGTGWAFGCCWCHRRHVPLPHLAKSKPVIQFPSSIPAIHPGPPPTHSTCTLTRKTLEACFRNEYWAQFSVLICSVSGCFLKHRWVCEITI